MQRLELGDELSKSPLPSPRFFFSQRAPAAQSTQKWANFRQIVATTKLAMTNISDGRGRVATTLTQYDQALRETRQF